MDESNNFWEDDLPDDVTHCLDEIEIRASQAQPNQLSVRFQDERRDLRLPSSSFLDKFPKSNQSSNVGPSSKLSLSQRKLQVPIKSLPNLSSSTSGSSNPTTEWLRNQLEKAKSNCSEQEKLHISLKGEINLLREKNESYHRQFLKEKELFEEQTKKRELLANQKIKELEKQLESAKLQIVLKGKESEANISRFKELKNVTVLEPVFASSQTPVEQRSRPKPIKDFPTPKLPLEISKRSGDISSDDDNEDLFKHLSKNKRFKKNDALQNERDETPKSNYTKRGEMYQVQAITRTKSISPELNKQSSKCGTSSEKFLSPFDISLTHLKERIPWITNTVTDTPKSPINLGILLTKEIGNKIYKLAEPELSVIVTPEINYNPKDVLKMDYSDLQYLKDLERGDSLWGVDLKTMYSDMSKENEKSNEEGDKEAFETVKTILGSQITHSSPERRSSLEIECYSKSKSLNKKNIFSHEPRDPMLLRTLEPIHAHLRALCKLSCWQTSLDIICPIVLYMTSMINDLYNNLCDPSIPNQLKTEFHNNEDAVGKLFMQGPYEEKDLLSSDKWTHRERYVELRRGIAVLAILCSLSRETVNVVLDSSLLNQEALGEESNSKVRFDYERSQPDSLSKIVFKKIVGDITTKTAETKETLNKKSSLMSNNAGTSNMAQRKDTNRTILETSTDDEVVSLLKKLLTPCDDNKMDSDSIHSSNSTIDPEEAREVDELENDLLPFNQDKNAARGNDSFRAWQTFFVEKSKQDENYDTLPLDSKLSKFRRLIYPKLSQLERSQINIYLQRGNRFNNFFKTVAEEGNPWKPQEMVGESFSDKRDESLMVCLKNVAIPSSSTSANEQMDICGVNNPNEDNSTEEGPDSCENENRSLPKNPEDHGTSKVDDPSSSSKPLQEKVSFFERLKTMERITIPPKNAFERVPNIKEGNLEEFRKVLGADNLHKAGSVKSFPAIPSRKHILAPLKKPIKKDTSDNSKFTSIQEEVEKEVELLYDPCPSKQSNFKQFKKKPSDISDLAVSKVKSISVKPMVLSNRDNRVLSMNDPRFEEYFYSLYEKIQPLLYRMNLRIIPFKQLSIVSKINEQKQSNKSLQLTKKRIGGSEKVTSCIEANDSNAMQSDLETIEDENSKAILNMLTEEAEKYDINNHIRSYEEKKGSLNILEGLYEIVSSINFCRMTLIFYPLLSSCILLIESIFHHSLNNKHFKKDSLLLLMKIINEIVCCQPPPDVLHRVLNIMMYASVFPDIIECLCKRRSPLVSLVTEQEFCFFKGVCLMQPLCVLVGALSKTNYSHYWEMSLAVTRWFKFLYNKYPIELSNWYHPEQSGSVCNCIPAQHNCVFTILSKATAYYANHALELRSEGYLKGVIEDIMRDGVSLCEILIDMDPAFLHHLRDFELYTEFLHTLSRIHSDQYFYPTFELSQYELMVVKNLIELQQLAKKREDSRTSSEKSQDITIENVPLNSKHFFFTRVDRYNLHC